MRTRSRLLAPGVALLGTLTLAMACSSGDERSAAHVARGVAHLAEARTTEAKLEFQSALRFDENNAEAHNRLSRIELQAGDFAAALAHMKAAYQADPSDVEASLTLASMIQAEDPDRAEELVDAVIERDPASPLGYIGRSNLALHGGRIPAALVAARKAMSVAPDEPRPDFQLGYILQAKVREGQLTGNPVDDAVYQSALAAFARYIKKGGESPWKAQIERARVLAAWRNHSAQAAKEFRAALESAHEHGTKGDLQLAAVAAASFSRSVKDWELREYALELVVEVEPRDYRSWQKLAEVRQRLRKDPEDTWKELIAARPDDPRAHIEYARFLVFRWKLDEALAYLERKADEGIEPTMLLGSVASTQLAASRMEDARRTVRRLETDYPGQPRTALSRAQLDIRQGKVSKATSQLRELTQQHSDPDAYLLLAQAELALGNREEALAAATEAVATHPVFAWEARRMQAQLLAEDRQWSDASRTLHELEERGALDEAEQLLLARCHYELGQVQRGRRLLESLAMKRRPAAAVILEYSRREGGHMEGRTLARRELNKLVQREPRNWAALREITHLDVEDRLRDPALERLNRAITLAKNETPPQIRLLRARTRAEFGEEQGTLEDAQAAFAGQPGLRGAMEFVVALHLRKGELAEALATAEAAQKAGALDNERRLLLARLYRMSGREAEAVATLQQALDAGAEDPSVYFHMGMALQALNRNEEATRALQKALAISPDFPEADHARRALEERGTGAS